jgi:hypothetical protein
LSKTGFRDNTKSTDHTRDGAEQTQQRRQGDDGIRMGDTLSPDAIQLGCGCLAVAGRAADIQPSEQDPCHRVA